MNYVIHCASKENLEKAVEMLGKILFPVATRIADRRIETVTGITVTFVTSTMELTGLKAEGYICIDDSNLDKETEFKLKLTSIY